MNKYINRPVVGIDVAAEFSMVAILAPDGEVYRKSFRINHTLDGFEYLASEIKKVEEKYDMKVASFMESTGVYHISLFHFLNDNKFDVFTINPLITNSNKNFDIRKVKNDKQDALAIAKICKFQNIKLSSNFDKELYTLKSLCREYYKLTDTKSKFKKKLSNELRVIFPGYLNIFSDTTSKSSLQILKQYPRPIDILSADKAEIINLLLKFSRKSMKYAENKYALLFAAAKEYLITGVSSDSLFVKLKANISIIENFEIQIDLLLSEIKNLLSSGKISPDILKNIELIQSIPGIGEVTSITILSEIGNFQKFPKPKKLVAFFGLDPSVNESGKFKGSNNHISKRGTRIGRRALYAVALASIRSKRNGLATNSILLKYYNENMNGKSKKVGLVAVMKKLLGYIFSILKNQKSYEIRNPELHCKMYVENQYLQVA